MGLDEILRALEKEAQEEERRILAEAQATAQRILAAAQERGQRIREEQRERIPPELQAEAARLINQGRLRRLGMLAEARETLVNEALAQAEGEFSRLRSQAEYPALLRQWTQELAEELGTDLVMEADAEDVPLLEGILRDMGLKATVEPSLNCNGGLAARTRDGRIRAINTIDSRLERARPFLRQEVAGILAATD